MKRTKECTEQLEREEEILRDRFVFNGHEWIELITEEELRDLETEVAIGERF